MLSSIIVIYEFIFNLLNNTILLCFAQMMARYIIVLVSVLAVIYAQQTETDTVSQNPPQQTLAAPLTSSKVAVSDEIATLESQPESTAVGTQTRDKRAPILLKKALLGGALLGAGALGAGVVGAKALGAGALLGAGLYKAK